MTLHWWWRCHVLHSLTAVADDSTLALSYRCRVITYETVCIITAGGSDRTGHHLKRPEQMSIRFLACDFHSKPNNVIDTIIRDHQWTGLQRRSSGRR